MLSVAPSTARSVIFPATCLLLSVLIATVARLILVKGIVISALPFVATTIFMLILLRTITCHVTWLLAIVTISTFCATVCWWILAFTSKMTFLATFMTTWTSWTTTTSSIVCLSWTFSCHVTFLVTFEATIASWTWTLLPLIVIASISLTKRICHHCVVLLVVVVLLIFTTCQGMRTSSTLILLL